MHLLVNNEEIVGAVAALVVIGAVLASPLFRGIALAAAASGICFLYAKAGVDGLLALSMSIGADLQARTDFAHGLIIGAILAGMMLAVNQLRRSA